MKAEKLELRVIPRPDSESVVDCSREDCLQWWDRDARSHQVWGCTEMHSEKPDRFQCPLYEEWRADRAR